MRIRTFSPADLTFALLLLLILSSLVGFFPDEEGSGFPDLRSLKEEKVDVNRADVATLAALPGVGPSLAERIIRFREAHGAFRHLTELQQVPGIGPKRFAHIASLLIVAEEGPWSTK